MMMVMTILDLFPVLMPNEDENCSVNNFISRYYKDILCLTGTQKKMLARESLLDISPKE